MGETEQALGAEDAHATERHGDPHQIESSTGQDRGQPQRPEELDGDRGPERNPVDRGIEGGVHRGQCHPVGTRGSPLRRRPPADTRPDGDDQDQGRKRQPQGRRTQHPGDREQGNRQRGAELQGEAGAEDHRDRRTDPVAMQRDSCARQDLAGHHGRRRWISDMTPRFHPRITSVQQLLLPSYRKYYLRKA